jgi:cytochrome c2/cytochrome b561
LADQHQHYSRGSVILGWLIAIVFSVHSAVTILIPRTEKYAPLREDLRSWHYLMGLTIFVLILLRLARWFRERVRPAPGMTPAGHSFTRQLALTVYLLMAVMPVLGILQAWSDGLTVRLGPFVTLPAVVGESRPLWMFSGYFHSALGFALLLIQFISVLTGAWLLLRRGVGMIAAFAPGFGAQMWLTFAVSVYAVSTLRDEQSPAGVINVGIFVALTVLVWIISRRRRRAAVPVTFDGARPSGLAVAGGAAVCLLALGFASYLPYQNFGVLPWEMGVKVAAPEGVTWHDAPVVRVTVTPETPFEATVKAEKYKWCRFCHTAGKGEKHLAGPNLYAIFGQRAGTVPGFAYSPAMAQRGQEGLIWDDETLDQFLAGYDRFVPGTYMKVSIGPITDPEERKAIINLLKKDTMPGAYATP